MVMAEPVKIAAFTIGREEFMQELESVKVLLVGKRNKKVQELKRTLAKHFQEVILASKLNGGIDSCPGDHFEFVVITDSVNDAIDRDYVYSLRRLFPQAKVVYLFEEMKPELEMIMRGIGLIFFGSYNYFGKNFPEILGSVFARKKENRKYQVRVH